jgi:rhamnulokinase
MPRFLAFDIGTSAGRATLGTLDSSGIALETLHRFPNRAVLVRGTLYWDVLYLWEVSWPGCARGRRPAI